MSENLHLLEPCPWCAAGTSDIKPNGRIWSGMKWSEPVSVSVQHWCEPEPGQPSRMIERTGRDEASAIAAWNRRAQPAAPADAAPSVAPEPVAMRPYNPTESMRWAARRIDPALPHEHIRSLWCVMWSAYAHPPRAPLTDEHPYTYTSTQATNCAGCGEYKHTPLRIDAMGGYVCLTCIDKKLGTVLGEFGYPAPQAPLSLSEISDIVSLAQIAFCLNKKPSFEVALAREVEAAHGINAEGEKP